MTLGAAAMSFLFPRSLRLAIGLNLVLLFQSGHAAAVDAGSGLTSRQLDAIGLHVLDPAAVERVRKALPPRTAREPMRLAMTVPTILDLDAGNWSEEDGGSAVWRARVQASGATLLIAAFDTLRLPPGAELRWSSLDGSVVQGPYSATDIGVDGSLWTALVPGDEALIELRVPQALRGQVALRLSQIGYGTHQVGRNNGVPAKSGNCNIDVVCPQGNGWHDQIRSVVHLQIPINRLLDNPSITLCSGQMINNTAQDGDPLLHSQAWYTLNALPETESSE